MNIFTVSFFGHRRIEDVMETEKKLETLIRTLLREHEFVEFLVGRDGEFDQIVSSAIRRCKREYRSDNSAHICVLPYLTAEFRDNEEAFRDYYDEIEVCEAASGSHYKKAHQTRNRAMVDRSDLVVFWVRQKGGAWQTMQYAMRKGKHFVNLNLPQTLSNGFQTI